MIFSNIGIAFSILHVAASPTAYRFVIRSNRNVISNVQSSMLVRHKVQLEYEDPYGFECIQQIKLLEYHVVDSCIGMTSTLDAQLHAIT